MWRAMSVKRRFRDYDPKDKTNYLASEDLIDLYNPLTNDFSTFL